MSRLIVDAEAPPTRLLNGVSGAATRKDVKRETVNVGGSGGTEIELLPHQQQACTKFSSRKGCWSPKYLLN